jgi:ribonucleoside-diphosphate reductase alpha chain
MIEFIIKRDKSQVSFDKEKIKIAMQKAFDAVGQKLSTSQTNNLLEKIVELLEKEYKEKNYPSVENISNLIEKILMENNYQEVARAFIIHRDYRRKIRELKKSYVGSDEKGPFTLNALNVLESRYLLKDMDGKVIENPKQMLWRVARAIAKAEKNYSKDKKKYEDVAQSFFDALNNLEFIPNSPALMNAGTGMGQLSACFVIPVEDDMTGIFDAIKHTALVHQSGGGTGFSFSRLRQKGARVKSTKGVASGPISFMQVFDAATEVIKQGGKRRGANMGILRVDHPDIIEFITCKQQEGRLANFNISIGLTDAFFVALENNTDYDLLDPKNRLPIGRMNAKSVFDLIANMAWTNGEPGIIFIDEMNRGNDVPHIGEIEATNPCGEQPLLPFESCNLGAINLAKMMENGKIDWKKLENAIRMGTRFLENMLDENKLPIPQIEKASRLTRKIGLGVMGWADMLIQLWIPYDSDEAIYLAEKIMKFIRDTSIDESVKLAEERGSFPAFKGSRWDTEFGYTKLRNAALTTIAPTGTTSMIADASSGIEPYFSLAFTKIALDEKKFVYVNKYFEKIAREKGFFSEELMHKISQEGSIQNMDEVPDEVKRVFKISSDISVEDHVKMQAAFQKYVHSAVSKTINMLNSATVDDVKHAYLLAYNTKCKGLTIYREGSRTIEVLTKGTAPKKIEEPVVPKVVQRRILPSKFEQKDKDKCPLCKTKLEKTEGCNLCPGCGYSKCST